MINFEIESNVKLKRNLVKCDPYIKKSPTRSICIHSEKKRLRKRTFTITTK